MALSHYIQIMTLISFAVHRRSTLAEDSLSSSGKETAIAKISLTIAIVYIICHSVKMIPNMHEIILVSNCSGYQRKNHIYIRMRYMTYNVLFQKYILALNGENSNVQKHQRRRQYCTYAYQCCKWHIDLLQQLHRFEWIQ